MIYDEIMFKGIPLSTPVQGGLILHGGVPQFSNSLPIDIRSAYNCTTSGFKQKLKTFLFSKAFL